MRFCIYCGEELEDYEEKCEKCGTINEKGVDYYQEYKDSVSLEGE